MSKNLTRKGLAFGAMVALGSTALVAVPAVAASGDLSIAPTTGTSYSVFSTDGISITASQNAFISADEENVGWYITNADQNTLLVQFPQTATDADTFDVTGIYADGSTVTIEDDAAVGVSATSGHYVIDFTDLNIVAAAITDFSTGYAGAYTPVINVITDPTSASDDSGVKTTSDAAALARLGYGDKDASISVQAWLESSAATLVDADYASAVQTVTFVDPANVSVISKVERVDGTAVAGGATTALNANADVGLAGSLRFSNRNINLDQIDLTEWELAITSSVSGATFTSLAITLGAASNTNDGRVDVIMPSGFTTHSAFGRLAFETGPGAALAEGETYKFVFRHGGDVTPFADYSSAAYQVVENTVSSTSVRIAAAPTTSVDVLVGTYNSGFPVKVRNGTSKVTYTSGILDASDGALEVANVPVLAKVTAGANLPTGATLTVSGTTETVTKAAQVVFVTGLTNSDGEWDLSVTSSDTASAGSNYTVDFYVLTQTPAWVTKAAGGSNNANYDVDYAAGVYSTFTPDSSVLSGAEAVVTFSIEDQFGEALSADSKGKAYSVELAAPAIADLDMDVAVVDGLATFSFTNWLAESESDVITAKLYTGSATSPSYVTGATASISVYNTNTVYAVNVLEEVTGKVVTYDDFITGASSATNVAPDDSSFTYIGTVVDSNGAGVPGAPVTITGTGFQFNKTGSTTYSIDSITLAASEAGSFSVVVYTHVASATGNALTATSGTKSAATLVKSAIPVDGGGTDGSTGLLSAANLKFTWDAPAAPVMNTTYAVTATVTDKWGNPVKGAAVTFSGYAAALFNGAATAAKTTSASGTAVAYLRSIKDVDGLAAIGVQLTDIDQDADALSDSDNLAAVLTDVKATAWDESTWAGTLENTLTFATTAADVVVSSDTKVNVGSFKGYVALYAKGYKGMKMSAIVAGKWIVVASLATDFERVVRYTGAGYDIVTTIYIDGAKVETFNVTTK